jgi:predicted small metal-binding protein
MKHEVTKADLNRSRAQTDQIVREVTDSVMKKVSPDTFDTQIVKKVNEMTVTAFDHFKRAHNLRLTPMKKMDAVEHIRALYKESMATWSKDELLEAYAMTLAVLGAESFHNELI